MEMLAVEPHFCYNLMVESLQLEVRMGDMPVKDDNWLPVALQPDQTLSVIHSYRIVYHDKHGVKYIWQIHPGMYDIFTEDILKDRSSLCYWLGWNRYLKPAYMENWDQEAWDAGRLDRGGGYGEM